MTVTKESLPTLDVVIPCYNEEDCIARCLDNLILEKKHISSIIVVDNNSVDGTADILKDYAKRFSKVHVLHESKQGIIPARNTGLNAAQADIIARIDADTIVETGWASAIRTYYNDHEKIAAASGFSWYYDLPARRITMFFTRLFAHQANRNFGEADLIYGANMSMRRTTWHRIRQYTCDQNGIMEDQDLGYHVIEAGSNIGYIPDAKAKVSGRRMRMSPLRFWRYNRQWWMTFRIHGRHATARRIRVIVWVGNVLQSFAWIVFQFYNPQTQRYSLRYFFSRDKNKERMIP